MRKQHRRPFSLRSALKPRRSSSRAKKPGVRSFASSAPMPCRLTKPWIGRQYVRQSFASASCAAADSPCASNTTLQCVVVNAAEPFCALPPTPVSEVTSPQGGTLGIQVKSCPESKLYSYKVLREVVGEEISRAMMDYFKPVMAWLEEQTKASGSAGNSLRSEVRSQRSAKFSREALDSRKLSELECDASSRRFENRAGR